MILCDDWKVDPKNARRVNIFGLISNIRSLDKPPYPLFYREFCVFLALTEGRGKGEGRIICEFEETGETIFTTAKQKVQFGKDPLAVVGAAFRIRNCTFPYPGLYLIQFWYNDELVEQRPMRLR